MLIHMMKDLCIIYHKTIHRQLLKNCRLIILFPNKILKISGCHQRIINVIIKNTRRNDNAFLIFSPLFLTGSVHIDHQLKLKAMKNRCQIKLGTAGLVINNFQKDLLILFTEIHSVDFAIEGHHTTITVEKVHMMILKFCCETHFVANRLKITLLQLLLQSPYRPFCHAHNFLCKILRPHTVLHN